MAEKKKEEGQIINEDIFGKDWESSDPKEGLTHLKIIAKNIGNIPGLVTHWEGDIKKRHDEILKAKNATFIMRAKAMLGGKFGKLYWEGVTGEDLAQHHPTKTATDLVERLKTDPMDYQARIALVTLLGQTGRELPVEVYRTMLLQSTVANTFGVFSIPGIQVALWAQNTYLNQLQAKCRHDVRTIENKIILAKKATGTEEQIKTLERLKAVINRNIRVIQEYMTQAAKATELSKFMFTEMFDINDIERQLNSDQSKPELKQHLYVKAYAIIHFLRYHLLLQTYAVDITDKFVLHEDDSELDPVENVSLPENALHENLKSISKMYAEELKYPPYSIPLTEDSYSFLTPYPFSPYQVKSEDGLFNMDILLPGSMIFKENPLPITFRIIANQSQPLPQVESVKAALVDMNSNQPVASFDMQYKENSEMEKIFYYAYQAPLDQTVEWGPEMKISVTVVMHSYGLITYSTPFLYGSSLAEVSELGDSSVVGSDLLIPVKLNLNKAGIVTVTGNLFSQTTNAPIAALFGEKTVTDKTATIVLKVHIVTLKAKNDPGPYLLKNIAVRIMPNDGTPLGYGNSDEKVFNIPAHSFDQYVDAPYTNPDYQQSIQQFDNWVNGK
ncbi:MAG: hypothetical protein HQM12_22335 [SAR324 cluster bacterium]|nr:hypothetical protein [SAR324 cluster bacterium]